MKIGTRSVLFGVHAFWLHPFILARAWWQLYGFPWDPRLWVAFFVHDLGYWGKPNMDGEEGERHPVWGARVMTRLFDPRDTWDRCMETDGLVVGKGHPPNRPWLVLGQWGEFTLLHSRFLARHYGRRPSRLCYADKLAIVLTPWWLYLPLARASGELAEYMDPDHHENGGKYEGEHHGYREDPKTWYLTVQAFLEGWLKENTA